MNSYMILPKMQLVGNYTQNGEDAAYVGGARAVAFQFFADGWGGGSGVAVFTIQHATSNSDDHFVDSGLATVTITEGGSPGYTSILVTDIDQIAAYVRIKVTLTLGGNTSIDVKGQINVMGGR